MGKGTDKLYITHSEWASADAFGASKGSGVRGPGSAGAGSEQAFRRLPFNYCAASLQPFAHPVCAPDGTVFDAEAIAAWLAKHKTNPVTGAALRAGDLVRLDFARNGAGDLIDPVTFKVFTDNTHIVALRHGAYANVFAWDTVERMNIKAKAWRDLVDDTPFTRQDILTLQDPQNVGSRDASQFQYVKEGQARASPSSGSGDAHVNVAALGRLGDKVLQARAAVDKARAARATGDVNRPSAVAKTEKTDKTEKTVAHKASSSSTHKAAGYTTGAAAASFTSTGLTPETSGARAVLSDEEWMLVPKRVAHKGYARVETSVGNFNVELHTETAPKAVWNFVRLAQQGYYRGILFHRNIRGFMIQGGDPSGTGRGGTSVWGKNFACELDGPHTHSARGVLSMANKGRDTNSSQFFVTYAPAKHLDRKHTVFGQVVDGLDTLDRLEAAPVGANSRPVDDLVIRDIVVYVDPFAQFLADRAKAEQDEARRVAVQRAGGSEDDKVTWTGKRLRGDAPSASQAAVGTYLKAALATQADGKEADSKPADDAWDEPAPKKAKTSGFGNFDAW